MTDTKLTRMAEWAVSIGASLVAFVFLLSGLVYTYLGRWRVTHVDFWRIYDVCLNHTWLEAALLKINNHALFFPTFLWLADLKFLHGNQLPLFLGGLALLFVTVSLLLIPVWHDYTVSVTSKVMATVVVIIGNFWMGRSAVIASGGYNCMMGLVIAGAALTFLLLPKMDHDLTDLPLKALIVTSAGFLASFSFATGLAIWPTLLVLAWVLRLPKHIIGLLFAAGFIAVFVFVLLPEASDQTQTATRLRWLLTSRGDFAFLSYARLLGSPFYHAASGWLNDKSTPQIQQFALGASFYSGLAGLMLAAGAVLPQVIRRGEHKSSLEFTGLGLIIFNVFALLLVLIGRVGASPISRPLGSYYLFWSTLFWTGLLLVGIKRAESKPLFRWPTYLAILALPILVFPSHYKAGLHQRRVMSRAELNSAILINGIRDDDVGVLFYGRGELLDILYRVASQLRVRRLDLFAEGLQDWIGVNETTLFGGRRKAEGLKGQCKVAALFQCDNGAPAARVIGQASKQDGQIPTRLVLIDPAGTIRGVACCLPTGPVTNRVFYLGKANTNTFLGYIRDYNPQVQYIIRSADGDALSEEKIPVQVLITSSIKL